MSPVSSGEMTASTRMRTASQTSRARRARPPAEADVVMDEQVVPSVGRQYVPRDRTRDGDLQSR